MFLLRKNPENAEFAILPLVFDTCPRPIFAHVQDGAGDRELRVFRGFSAIKTPTNRLQAGKVGR